MAFDRSRRRKCSSAARITAQVLLSALTLVPHSAAAWGFDAQQPLFPNQPVPARPLSGDNLAGSVEATGHTFTLRHVFHRGTTKYPSLHRRLDVSPNKVQAALRGESDEEDGIGPFHFKTTSSANIMRLRPEMLADLPQMLQAAQKYGATVTMPDDAWTLDEVESPDITDQETVVNFALMTASAYNRDQDDPEWEEIKPPFNLSTDIGWEHDGLRGHVFATEDNSTIVVSIKGTSSALFDGAETTTNDKENDNLFAGCCCGQGSHMSYRKVCDCMTSAMTCNDTCVTKSMRAPNRYFPASNELYSNVTDLYPGANVWLTGHSLGGLVSGLLGLEHGQPVVTFEAVPQALAASRLGLPTPPGYSSLAEARGSAALWNFGHTADPVYMGTCNSLYSVCAMWGYALESQCHMGARCTYDTVNEWKWRQLMSTHGIRGCIKDVYRQWEGVPECAEEPDCQDCFAWDRYESNGSDITTTTTSSSTSTWSTRTETCKDPGWWGCRDPSTTTELPSTTSTSVIVTETCVERGWFGQCLTEVTTTYTSLTTMPITETTTTSSDSISKSSQDQKPTAAPTTSCETPGYFWGCNDESTTTTTSTAAMSTITEPP